MKLLTSETSYNGTIKLVPKDVEKYKNSIIFHCYWNGQLNEKHLYSILSCYYFNVYKNNHKIILWLENNIPTDINKEILKYAEILPFDLKKEQDDLIWNSSYYINPVLSHYSDIVRYSLLYKYGGCWFDLDIFFLKSFDPIFSTLGSEICVYQWSTESYPNGAIFISLTPEDRRLKDIIKFIINRNKGWGFQEASLTYDLPLDFLVLPCSWFDANWLAIKCCLNSFFESVDSKVNFDNFMTGSFCYHWHNRWNHKIGDKSPFKQLVNIVYEKLNSVENS